MSITEQRHIILQDAVKLASEVATKVPPLWDLPNYVAVNPFLGFSHRPIERAAAEINDALAAELFPPLDYFRQAMARGAFDLSHAREAASRVAIDEQMITSVLAGKQDMPMREVRECPSFMRRHDAAHGTRLEESVLRSIARWCAVYVEAQSTAWAFRADEIGLYRSWREAESADRSLEIAGLRGWRAYVQSLPGHPADALSTALAALPVDADDHHAYLHSLIGALYGWASYFRRQNWQRAEASAGDVLDLLAICASADAGVYELASMPRGSVRVPLGRMVQEEAVRQALQEALEDGYVHTLIAAGVAQPPPRIKTVRPAIQAAFCIDVRSEPLRRHLEAQSDSVQTIGFAGFFGVALSMEDGSAASARCPVLLSPSVSIRPRSGSADANDTIKHLQAAPAAAFSFVELAGWAYGGGLLRSAVAGDSNNVAKECRHGFRFGNSNERTSQAWKADLASGILKNMGLRGELARIVMLCGHEGRSTNNPHAAGLDCGACGGHGGGLNAQVAAELLNDSDVRRALVDRGVTVPPDTIFVPAVHDTSVDEVTFLGANLPAAHEADLATLRQWLTKAAQATRDERSGRLGIKANARRTLLSRLTRRANDWSQVRPEWGLARNASFVAARRCRTRRLHLDGRAFLHDYDCAFDADGSVLTLIMTAPLIVASWINLQYLASTVDNRRFGAGDKALHNRVGRAGVVLGNGGDLRAGLPLQSVHGADGAWFHEPLRLQVIIEAPQCAIDAVLAANSQPRDLVDNGWIRLFALDPTGEGLSRRGRNGGWHHLTTHVS